MQARALALGVVFGVALGLGSVLAADIATEPADAQSGSNFATKADLQRVERNSSAAQRVAKWVQNQFGVYYTPPDELIGLDDPEGQVRQERGKGLIGLPSSRIGDGAVTGAKIAADSVGEAKLTPAVREKLDQPGPRGPVGSAGPTGPPGPAGSLTGPAGGGLSGEYPDPTIATGAVGIAQLSSEVPWQAFSLNLTVPAHGCISSIETLSAEGIEGQMIIQQLVDPPSVELFTPPFVAPDDSFKAVVCNSSNAEIPLDEVVIELRRVEAA